jgi:hypothetical protein
MFIYFFSKLTENYVLASVLLNLLTPPYVLYHDVFERNETPEHTEEPMFANRPMHCASTEIRAQ